MQGLVSIIIPTYNSARFIADTIQSVKNQTYTNWEIILVDDASTDDTILICQSFSKTDSRIKCFELSVNSGTGTARNFGLTKAFGDFIAYLDSDDLWKPFKLQKQLDFMNKNNLSMTFSFYECIDENGISLNKMICAPQKLTFRKLIFCNYIGNLTGIYNVNLLGKIPIPDYRKRQDWMMWLSILQMIKIAHPVPESLAYYRIRSRSISASKVNLLKHNFAVYRFYLNKNIVNSIGCMSIFLFTQIIVKRFYVVKLKNKSSCLHH